MAFRGWKIEALEFYEGLEAENTKSYWQRHKDVYADVVRAPMEQLLAELEPAWGEGKIFRPYRDVRFSRDKSPYKTAIGATVGRGGYVQLDARGLAAGAGMWEMASDQLGRYRRAVAADPTGAELSGIVEELRGQGLDVSGRERLKTAPKGYPKDHPRIELLRMKGLIAWREWPAGAWLGTAKAKDRVVAFLTTSRPLVAWLHGHVGPSTMPDQ
ncbi:MAG TPA: DUF2461 domain-containing protein, partial [Actinomycetota bacterium]|nr:DUF2461 domain-containing protein [Actinomycetota bacterium]